MGVRTKMTMVRPEKTTVEDPQLATTGLIQLRRLPHLLKDVPNHNGRIGGLGPIGLQHAWTHPDADQGSVSVWTALTPIMRPVPVEEQMIVRPTLNHLADTIGGDFDHSYLD